MDKTIIITGAGLSSDLVIYVKAGVILKSFDFVLEFININLSTETNHVPYEKEGNVKVTDRVFVYGTLLKGEYYHHIIKDQVKSVVPATIRGWMFDLGPYPAIVEGSGYIHGQIIELHDPDKAFQSMDLLEGYHDAHSPLNEYERVYTEAWTNDHQVMKCQVYRYPDDRKINLIKKYPLILNGNWKQRKVEPWHLYFAYGSCMNRQSFSQNVPKYKVVGKAELENYRVGFTRRSKNWNDRGVADILYETGSVTEGVLYLIPHYHLKDLDIREGAGEHLINPAYRRILVNIKIDNLTIPAYTYEVVQREKNEIPPSEEYARTIIEGAALLSNSYLNRLVKKIERLRDS
ncbi:gamma-glutamylcyclotransferase [Microaerobacter geothermalis]|uniref:gamma-glutamylcyclotransferase n=1 Tax=Microaerobacter geothermalis TaxID=674972 RepID=UPI001F3721B0|nr:gamma-glutamylcyclotransferase [Microaerobacter geothermalis]MCF6093111.1 gamma-glutamylcyclotransferase [Microaerobacter geothermalis]